MRADKYIAEILGLMSRSQIKARKLEIFVDGKKEKLSRKLLRGERLELRWVPEPARSFKPEKIEVPLIYEDEDVFIFDKPQGMVTHPANGHWSGTLANAVAWIEEERKEELGRTPERHGIVHRLDKDTSGLIVVARNAHAHEFLSSQFKSRSVRKEYLAIVSGVPREPEGRIESRLGRDRRDRKRFSSLPEGGKYALTIFKVRKTWDLGQGRKYSLLSLYPRTGRTHQLRVHMSELGHPIIGDPIYGRKDGFLADASLMLHARRLKIVLPSGGGERVFTAALPERFLRLGARLDSAAGFNAGR